METNKPTNRQTLCIFKLGPDEICLLICLFIFRFIRKGIDPAPLAENGLTEELLDRLSTAASPRGHNTSITGRQLVPGVIILVIQVDSKSQGL